MCREIIIAFTRALGGTERCQQWTETEWNWEFYPFSAFFRSLLFALFSFFFFRQILVSLSSSLTTLKVSFSLHFHLSSSSTSWWRLDSSLIVSVASSWVSSLMSFFLFPLRFNRFFTDFSFSPFLFLVEQHQHDQVLYPAILVVLFAQSLFCLFGKFVQYGFEEKFKEIKSMDVCIFGLSKNKKVSLRHTIFTYGDKKAKH